MVPAARRRTAPHNRESSKSCVSLRQNVIDIEGPCHFTRFSRISLQDDFGYAGTRLQLKHSGAAEALRVLERASSGNGSRKPRYRGNREFFIITYRTDPVLAAVRREKFGVLLV